jgi:nucleoid-associated protein YgaU
LTGKEEKKMKPDWMKKSTEPTNPPAPPASENAPRVGRPDWMNYGKSTPAEAPAEGLPEVVTEVHVEEVGEEIAEVAVVAEAETDAPPTSYTVQVGDSLTSIATKLYGSPEQWVSLWRHNKTIIPDPNLLRPGQVLQLPSL